MQVTLDVVGRFADLKPGDRVWYCFFDIDEGPVEAPVSSIKYRRCMDGLHVDEITIECPSELNPYATETILPKEAGASLKELVDIRLKDVERRIKEHNDDIARLEKLHATYRGWLLK